MTPGHDTCDRQPPSPPSAPNLPSTTGVEAEGKTSLKYILTPARKSASEPSMDVAPPFTLGKSSIMSIPMAGMDDKTKAQYRAGIEEDSKDKDTGPNMDPSASASGSKPPAPQSTSTESNHVSTSTSPRRSRLESLPRHLISIIAYHMITDDQGQGHSPSALIPLFLTSKKIYENISFDNNPQLYNNLFRATFDHAALTRRYLWMVKHLSSMAGRGRKIYDLFSDPASWAHDYRDRWTMSKRVRRAVKEGVIQGQGDQENETLLADTWIIWFLLTENDGRNTRFLNDECNFKQWILLFHRNEAVNSSLVPGYPTASAEKSLATWSGLLSGIDPCESGTKAQIDEKIFALRPYVFACAKYDIFIAPWNQRRLPFDAEEHEKADRQGDPRLRPQAVGYKRFGFSWRRTPPSFTICCILEFLRLIDRHARRMGLTTGASTFSASPNEQANTIAPGLFTVTRIMPSIYHDREWQRNTICQDPSSSPGLPALTFRGELQGFWRGKFLFYDFDMYRQMLAGDMRAVYTGTFAEQAVEVELKETVIKVPVDRAGGDGPTLCAGFDAVNDGDAEDREQKRIEGGYGYEVCENENEADKPGWTKEILLSGRARTSWGWGRVKGRVRAWDGLIVLCVSYSRHVMGRWLWRGYIETGGHLIGRWRDTFTPEHLRGYEGSFGMLRAGDIFYPPHFPKRMEDSYGVNDHHHIPGQGPSAPSLPPSILLSRPLTQSFTSHGGHGHSHVHHIDMDDLTLPPIRTNLEARAQATSARPFHDPPVPDPLGDSRRSKRARVRLSPLGERSDGGSVSGTSDAGSGGSGGPIMFGAVPVLVYPERANPGRRESEGSNTSSMKIDRRRESNIRGGSGEGKDREGDGKEDEGQRE